MKTSLLCCATLLCLLNQAWAQEEAPLTPGLFTPSPVASKQLGLRTAYHHHSNQDQASLLFTARWALLDDRLGLSLVLPGGWSRPSYADMRFSYGDVELGVMWNLYREPTEQMHFSLGLDLTAPTARIGENKHIDALIAGREFDDSNYGKRASLTNQILVEVGLAPKLNIGVRPWLAFGMNLGTVSLQAAAGLQLLIMDRVEEALYFQDKRFGALAFFDLAAPVRLNEQLDLVAEFHSLLALGDLHGTGFAFTLGGRYRFEQGLEAAFGLQLPLGVDGEGEDDDLMLGRASHAILSRRQVSVVLDLAYRF
ncbi:MAG: hypothetical protein JRF33_01860 [Deltaproteobacteria bacterium]|nr:hypothetical protein [Deltaproteobacteria bacterium]